MKHKSTKRPNAVHVKYIVRHQMKKKNVEGGKIKFQNNIHTLKKDVIVQLVSYKKVALERKKNFHYNF